jgi:hypothetical protein
MKKKGSTPKSWRDPLQIQISAHVKIPRGRRITANVIRQAIEYRLDHGENPPGIELEIVQWRNPGRKSAALRAWRSGSQEAAWGTLGNALRGWLAENNTITVAMVKS